MSLDAGTFAIVRALSRRRRPLLLSLAGLLTVCVGLLVLYRGIQRSRCVDPKPVLVDGRPTGFERCASRLEVRREPMECPSLLPRPPDIDAGDSECSDADCTEHPHGYCRRPLPLGTLECVYGCTLDSECAGDELCHCEEPVGRCVKASCRAASDCPLTGLCAENAPSPGCWFSNGFACMSLRDECTTSADCGRLVLESCGWENGRRVCTGSQCFY